MTNIVRFGGKPLSRQLFLAGVWRKGYYSSGQKMIASVESSSFTPTTAKKRLEILA